jgi:hypothetical protein
MTIDKLNLENYIECDCCGVLVNKDKISKKDKDKKKRCYFCWTIHTNLKRLKKVK